MIIGTHALIQEKVQYRNLALVITDEQHRFGVKQREALTTRGAHPHVLVMSATPIPRTLAIILYGDLDISVIDELPARRLPIKNCVVDTSYRPQAYRFMERQIREGRQVYVICPMVEEKAKDWKQRTCWIIPESCSRSFRQRSVWHLPWTYETQRKKIRLWRHLQQGEFIFWYQRQLWRWGSMCPMPP